MPANSESFEIPRPYHSITRQNFETFDQNTPSDDSLSRYFEGCFDDVYRMAGLYKTWVCVACLPVGKHSYGGMFEEGNILDIRKDDDETIVVDLVSSGDDS